MVEVMIDVEVVYAAVDRQALLTVTVPAGTTVRAALLRSAVAEEFPELDLTHCAVGIFGSSGRGSYRDLPATVGRSERGAPTAGGKGCRGQSAESVSGLNARQ
jgi:hypothetical protein